ncbi:MAG TPA: hypothetical protein VII69_09615 [Candidatus Eremiobacteraceae bacterium]
MKMRAMLLGATIVLTSCGASQSHPVAAAVSTPVSEPSTVASTGRVAPQSGASEAARAAGAELRSVIIPKIRNVPASGVTSPATAAGAEPRKVTIPIVRGVPARGVTSVATPLPKGVPYASDTDPVRIVSVLLSSNIVHPGDKVTGDVVTSSNAASVTARVSAFSVAVPKIAPGKFHLEMKLPSLPLPPGDTKLTITAVRTDGKSTTREIAITVVL